MAAPQQSTAFEEAADKLLTETVKVIGLQRTPGEGGGEQEDVVLVEGLRASIQPAASLDQKTMLGRLPDMSHLMFCRAEDANALPFDFNLLDVVEETTRTHRKFVILAEPTLIPDPHTGGWHHLEMQLQESRL